MFSVTTRFLNNIKTKNSQKSIFIPLFLDGNENKHNKYSFKKVSILHYYTKQGFILA